MRLFIGFLLSLFLFQNIFCCDVVLADGLKIRGHDEVLLTISSSSWSQSFPSMGDLLVGDIIDLSQLRHVTISADELLSLDKLLQQLERGEKYSAIYQELVRDAHIEKWLKLLLALGVDDNSDICCLVSQAFACRAYNEWGCAPDNTDAITALFSYFDKNYPLLANSLKVYTYLSRDQGEGKCLNTFLRGSFSVDEFLSQVPARVVQFACADSFSLNFSNYAWQDRYVSHREALDCHYLPFAYHYYCPPRDRQRHRVFLEEAVKEDDIVAVERVLDAGIPVDSNSCGNAWSINDGVTPLWKAVVWGNLSIVQLLLSRGADPLKLLRVNVYDGIDLLGYRNSTILEEALLFVNYEPIDELVDGHTKRTVLDQICCSLLDKALERDPEKLGFILKENVVVRERALSLRPMLLHDCDVLCEQVLASVARNQVVPSLQLPILGDASREGISASTARRAVDYRVHPEGFENVGHRNKKGCCCSIQ